MKKFLLAGIALSALIAAPAMAADLGVRPAPAYKAAPVPVAYGYNWTGIYIGADAGGAWGRKCWTFIATPNEDDGCHDVSGWMAGGQIGALWQTGAWVFGVEGKWDWADLDGRSNSVAFPDDFLHTRIDSVGLVTGRIGYAWDAFMIYAKGGGAWVHDKYEVGTNIADIIGIAAVPAGGVFASANEWRWGWTVGGGVEFGFAQNWSIAAEYDYIGLGTKTVRFTGDTTFDEDIKQNLHAATVRLNYHFGAGKAPVAARY